MQLVEDRCHRLASEDIECATVQLPRDWDAYLATIQKRLARRVRALMRTLPAEHDGKFMGCVDATELEGELDSMFRLHQKRWMAADQPGSFSLQQRRDFYREMAQGFLRRGWLRLYLLQLGDRRVAYHFCFQYGSRLYALQHAYEPDCHDLSVGKAIMGYAIRDAIERGASEYDALRGLSEYKAQWGATARQCVSLTLTRPGLRTQWYAWFPHIARRVRERGRSITPDPLLRLKRRLQKSLRQARRSQRR
jgi:CelD/BcsL family acetyltransferase involved in cellulose biosynthesis